MYDIKLRYLASVYVDADSIKPDAKIVSGLQEAISDEKFIPTQAFESTGPGIVKQRIALHTPNDGWQLVILGKRFNFVLFPITIDGKNLGEFSDFCKEAAKKLSTALKYFGLKAHRVAALKEGLLPEMKNEEMNALCRKIMKLPKTFSENIPFEWDWRSASLIERTFGDCTEKTNTIVTIKRFKGTLSPPGGENVDFDRIRVDFDINTSPEESMPRFGEKDVEDFFNSLNDWHKNLEEEISAFLKE